MTDEEELRRAPRLARAVETLRTLEPLTDGVREAARARLQRRLEEEKTSRVRVGQWWRSLVAPRSVRLAPLAAAGILLCALLAGTLVGRLSRGAPADGGYAARATGAARSTIASAADGQLVRFVCVAPNAERVSLVGDFNRWSAGASPMRPERGGVWTVELRVPAGRHLYAFLVDGRDWRADAAAPLAGDGSFGKPTSVVLVGD